MKLRNLQFPGCQRMQSVNEAVQEHPSLKPAVFPQHAAA